MLTGTLTELRESAESVGRAKENIRITDAFIKKGQGVFSNEQWGIIKEILSSEAGEDK